MISFKRFTLIEVMIAVALSLVVTSMVAAVYQQTGRVTRGLRTKAQIHDELRTILNIISQDLSGYYFVDDSELDPMNGGNSSGDYIDFTTLSLYSTNENVSFTVGYSGSSTTDNPEIPFGHVAYRYDDSEDKLYRDVESNWENGDSLSTFKNRTIAGTTVTMDDNHLVAEGITTFEIEYNNAGTWGNTPSNFPSAVKITIEKQDVGQDSDAVTIPVRLQTTVFIKYQQ